MDFGKNRRVLWFLSYPWSLMIRKVDSYPLSLKVREVASYPWSLKVREFESVSTTDAFPVPFSWGEGEGGGVVWEQRLYPVFPWLLLWA